MIWPEKANKSCPDIKNAKPKGTVYFALIFLTTAGHDTRCNNGDQLNESHEITRLGSRKANRSSPANLAHDTTQTQENDAAKFNGHTLPGDHFHTGFSLKKISE